MISDSSGVPVLQFGASQVAAVPLGAKLPKGTATGLVGAAAPAAAAPAPADEDEVDLWGDEEDDEEAEAANEARLKAIADAHKAKKAAAVRSVTFSFLWDFSYSISHIRTDKSGTNRESAT
eukprot:SAG31_NODE_8565_length_1429_cov_1.427068_2_plen_120_part_01